MAKPLDTKEIVTIQEIAISDMLEIEALIELLDEKGIITKDELMEKCKKMRGKIRGGRCLFEPAFVSFGLARNSLIQLSSILFFP